MNATRARRSSPLASPRLEAQAGQAGRSLFGPAPRRLGLAPVAAPETRLAPPAPGGRPLGPVERALFESRLGHDFSRVRVHHDAAADEAAREQEARAFTVGDHIRFAHGEYRPDSPDGRELMAHELAHTVQQRNAQGVQHATPKGVQEKQEPRLGDAPPDQKVGRAEGKGGEEEHFLFKVGKADLPADAAKKLQALLGRHKGTLTVKIHGYASEEGSDDLNFNLGAHRAIALENAIRPLLPPGAAIEVCTHGPSKFFGPREENRRAGVEILEAVTPPAPAAPATQPAYSLDPRRKSSPGSLLPPLSPLAPYLAPPSFLAPPGPLNLPDPYQPTIPLDWPAMSQPYYIRGIRLTDRDFTSIQDNWSNSVLFLMRNFGLSPDQAAATSNALLPFAYDTQLGREEPNQADKMNQEMEAQEKMRGGWHTPQVPVLSVIKFFSGGKFKPEF